MTFFYEILRDTPWWVYVILASVLMLGIRGLKPRVVSLKRLFILPFIFTAWSVYTLVKSLSSFQDVSIWTLCLLLGVWYGRRLLHKFTIQADKKKGLITVEGGPLTLILALCIFITKYFFGFLYIAHPAAMKNVFIFTADLLTSGFITGLFFGKALYYLRKYKRAPHTNLIAD